ncbi:alpha-amylase family glycosyl hydrolase [Brachybacterium huguangmaarense]|uniref:Alpha-amylase family glycosyl hydrolase n=1 Tax=Brachybacterium huguangmaarense TaxID=1652028 RepID=A0ABY6G2Q3_9MICO|nr:alpha-amylase family glycosyl hydrolase [Brachybacterium huguangmaarense]UYG17493.1 alpha-amylase family glycosyl hydrolase [Brachybacterium huguangmaarense]
MSERPTSTPPPVPAWLHDAIAWQVYPLGFCGAPLSREDLAATSYGDADGENIVHRLGRLTGWLDHLVSLGANVLILNPIFDSVSHGYDTLDHRRIDPRLGDEADFAQLVEEAHRRGIRVVLDGVFNHVSDRHPAVRRAVTEGPASPDGQRIRWAGDFPYGFEGNSDLVELNLADPAVQDAIVDVMGLWLDRGADGWRLDAMYAAGPEAWAPILERVKADHPEAWILGEVLHGDDAAFAATSGADSITQYELWKAIWSSLHDTNLFELAHALRRGEEFRAPTGPAGHVQIPQTFLGNHDTTRIASQLPDGRDLAVAVALLALLPGVPTVYAGDEFGALAVKEDRAGGDDAVRPVFPASPEALLDAAVAGDRARLEAAAGDPAREAHGAAVLSLLKPDAAPRILEVHRRLLGLRRREPWLADAAVTVDEGSLANEYAEIALTGTDGDGQERRLLLVLNLSDEDRGAPGEVLEAVRGANMIDGVGGAGDGTVPAHGVAVVR